MACLQFLFLRWWLRRTVLPLPYVVFLSFELPEILRIGGMRAVREAVDGWVAKQQDAWQHAFAEATKKPIREVSISENWVWREYAPEDPVTVHLLGGATATLRDVKFQTVATVVVKRFSNLIDGDVEVTVNGQSVGLGYWLRPGDIIFLTKISRVEAGKK